MRIAQVNCLNEPELALLLYIVNVVDPICPPGEISIDLLPSIKHDVLLMKIAKQEPHINDEHKHIFQSLLMKLSKTWMEEVQSYARSEHEHNRQLQFTLWTQLQFRFEI
jgi:hypothetical protein